MKIQEFPRIAKNKLTKGALPLFAVTGDPRLPDLSRDYGTVGGFVGLIIILLDWAYTFLLAAAVIFVVYAAFLYVTANGDAEKVGKANKIILYAAIGVAIGVMAKAIAWLPIAFFGVDKTKPF